MKVDSKYFGQVEIEDEKIIHFEKGILGFEEYKDYTILYDNKGEERPFFSWLQCVTEKGLAFPVVNPFQILPDYNPVVEDAQLEVIGKCDTEDLLIFLMATVPEDIKKTSVNLKAPLIINSKSRRAVQLIAENEDYVVKYMLIRDEE